MRLKLKSDTLYEVTQDYYREVLPLIYKLKKGDLVKLEPSFGGNIRVLKQNPDEDGTYKHHLTMMNIEEARKILIERK